MKNELHFNFIKENNYSDNSVVELNNCRVADVENGSFFDQNVSVLIKNGKILSLPGMDGEINGIEPDFSIDLKGKTLFPTLFNVHCHVQMINPTLFSDFKTIKAKKKFHDKQVEKNMSDCLARGITNIRDAYSDNLKPTRLLTERILKREIPGPRIMQAVVVGSLGGYFIPEYKGLKKVLMEKLGLGTTDYGSSDSGVVPFSFDGTSQQIRDAVDRAIDERGGDLIKVGESLEKSALNSNPSAVPFEQMEIIADQAFRRGVQSTIHSVSLDTFRKAVKAGFSSLAHMPRDGSLTWSDIDLFINSKSIIEPTLSVGYDFSWRLKEDPYRNEPNLAKLYEFRNKTFTDVAEKFWVEELKNSVIAGFNKGNLSKYKMLGIFNLTKLLAHFSRLAKHGIENTKMLVEQGATIACGNDGGVQACTPAMVAHELAIFDLFMREENSDKKLFDGVSAVKMATIDSAKSMGLDKRFGSIKTGKIADLIVIGGNPFENPGIIGEPVDALFMDGRLVINNCSLEVKK